MTRHQAGEKTGLSENQLELLNNELFSSLSCIITDIYHTGGGEVGFELLSECGTGWVEIPGDNPLTDVMNVALLSSDYVNILCNQTFGSFDKKTLLYVLNMAAPKYGSSSDSYTITQIITSKEPGNIQITDLMFTLHPYGDYTLNHQPAFFKKTSEHTLYEVVSTILESIIDEDNMDMGAWKAPSASEVASISDDCPIVGSTKALLEYGKKLTLV